jgi:N-acetylmuramoyl-L-alanine amidase
MGHLEMNSGRGKIQAPQTTYCNVMLIETVHLPYVAKLAARNLSNVDLVIIHCTELPDLTMAREYGERIHYAESGTGNSGHYYVDRDGRCLEYVPMDHIAHHCRDYNPRSIGIELVNLGRYPHWLDSRSQTPSQPYPAAQIASLQNLLKHLRLQLPSMQWIAGHEDLDTAKLPASDDPTKEVFRKRDPGPMFPWDQLLPVCGLKRLQPC